MVQTESEKIKPLIVSLFLIANDSAVNAVSPPRNTLRSTLRSASVRMVWGGRARLCMPDELWLIQERVGAALYRLSPTTASPLVGNSQPLGSTPDTTSDAKGDSALECAP